MGAAGEFRRKLAAWISNDPALAASDQKKIPTQRAVKEYVDAAVAARISTALASAKILVGNGSGVAAAVSMSGDATLSNAGVLTLIADASGFAFVVDEDDMASDDNTLLPTQQSVKAYVDAVPLRTYRSSSMAGTITGPSATTYLKMGGGQNCTSAIGDPMIRSGSIVGMVAKAYVDNFVAAGAITFEVRVNNSAVLTLGGSVTAAGMFSLSPTTQAAGVDTFSAGDVIQTYCSIDASGTYRARPFMAFEIEWDS